MDRSGTAEQLQGKFWIPFSIASQCCDLRIPSDTPSYKIFLTLPYTTAQNEYERSLVIVATLTPVKNVQSEAEKLKASVALPDAPGFRCSWDQAQAYFQLLSPEQWENVESYIYRIKPQIVRQLSNSENPNYIEVIQGRVNKQDIINNHGGGIFQLQVRDRSKGQSGKKIMEVKLEVPFSEAEPILDYTELDLNARENKAYVEKLINTGKLTRDGKPVTPTTIQQQNSSDTVGVLKEVMGIVSKLNNDQLAQLRQNNNDPVASKVGDILLEKMKQDNPSQLITAITQVMGQQKTSSDFAPMMQLVTTLITQMSSAQAQTAEKIAALQSENTKLMIEMIKDNKKSGGSDGELGEGSFKDKLLSIVEIARLIKGGNTPESSTVDKIIDGVSSALPNILQTINTAFQYGIASKTGMGGGFTPAPTALPEIAAPSTDPNGRSSDLYKNPQKVVTMPSEPKQPEQPMQPVNQLQQVINQYGGLILQHMNSGTDGATFAALVVDMVGVPTHAIIARQDDETIITAAKSVPQFWQQIDTVFGEAHFRKWWK